MTKRASAVLPATEASEQSEVLSLVPSTTRAARPDLVEVIVAEDLRIAETLADTVIRTLFGAGLELQALVPLVNDEAQQRLLNATAEIDRAIREMREAIFGLSDRATDA